MSKGNGEKGFFDLDAIDEKIGTFRFKKKRYPILTPPVVELVKFSEVLDEASRARMILSDPDATDEAKKQCQGLLGTVDDAIQALLKHMIPKFFADGCWEKITQEHQKSIYRHAMQLVGQFDAAADLGGDESGERPSGTGSVPESVGATQGSPG